MTAKKGESNTTSVANQKGIYEQRANSNTHFSADSIMSWWTGLAPGCRRQEATTRRCCGKGPFVLCVAERWHLSWERRLRLGDWENPKVIGPLQTSSAIRQEQKDGCELVRALNQTTNTFSCAWTLNGNQQSGVVTTGDFCHQNLSSMLGHEAQHSGPQIYTSQITGTLRRSIGSPEPLPRGRGQRSSSPEGHLMAARRS